MSEQNQQDDIKIVIAITIYAILASLINVAISFNTYQLRINPVVLPDAEQAAHGYAIPLEG
jgi:hypothetical protein